MTEYVEVVSIDELEMLVAEGRTVYLKEVNGGFHSLSPDGAARVLREQRGFLGAGFVTYRDQ